MPRAPTPVGGVKGHKGEHVPSVVTHNTASEQQHPGGEGFLAPNCRLAREAQRGGATCPRSHSGARRAEIGGHVACALPCATPLPADVASRPIREQGQPVSVAQQIPLSS